MPLRKVIEPEPGEELPLGEQRMLRMGELDFLVADRDGEFRVAFGVEFDGPYHSEPERAAKDRVKDGLLLRADLPLVRVPDTALGEKEQITLLEWIVECFVILRTRRPEVEAKLAAMVSRAADGARDRLFHNEAPGPVPLFNTAAAVAAVHPFPPNRTVRDRLERRYGIFSHSTQEPVEGFGTSEELKDSFDRAREAPLLLYGPAGPIDEDGEPVGDVVALGEEGAVVLAEECLMVLVRPGSADDVPFVSHQPIRRSPQDFDSQFLASERVGIAMFSADAALAEYFALTDVERWAERNLVRLDR